MGTSSEEFVISWPVRRDDVCVQTRWVSFPAAQGKVCDGGALEI